jgi:membrane protein DedA with SNARE-associated domain
MKFISESTREMTHAVLEHLAQYEPVLGDYGYPLLFAANLVEGFGIPMPGQALLMAGAVLGGRVGMNIWTVCAVTWLATLTGNIIGYLIGCRGGTHLLDRFRANSRHVQRVDDFYRRYGVPFVVGSRFVDGLRQLTSLVAGSMKMPWWSFFWSTAAGATLWVGLWGLGLYYLDQHLHGLLHAVHHVRPYMVILSMLLFGLLLYYLFKPPAGGRNGGGGV